ncbi:hypothetical protein [Paenibacillus polymyxa]|uniref:hypothetical protein n=1 Tax=Paenibacillus polymyxa TaxID=1406 RepID=UPI00298C97DB|nr:hypothetical protein [Paenibacillus polymyxa]
MCGFPPEKYYEACITYNLVNEFKERFETKLYPFSISQIEERNKGYDFGYFNASSAFFIQYKRPFLYDINKGVYQWKIDREQLKTINSQSYYLQTYYALPAFVSNKQWFEGLDHTYFIDASKLQEYLINKNGAKTSSIFSNNVILREWETILSKYTSRSKNLASLSEVEDITIEDLILYAKDLEQNVKESTWLYLLEEDDEF